MRNGLLLVMILLAQVVQGSSAQAGTDAAIVDWQGRIDAAVRAADDAEAGWRQRIGTAVGTSGEAASVDNLPKPASVPVQDVGQLAERFQGYLDRQRGGDAAPGGLSVFVSLSMPRASLQRLIADAEATGATLVLRGMVERSISKTAIAVQKLIGERRVAWTIDPDAFRRFNVEAVPVFVLTRAGAQSLGCGDDQCLPDTDYVRLTGDVSIGYALDTIDRLQPDFHAQVEKARAGR
ncbi:type-F conjugative transfer system pilin assembly protein TrbC [Parasulfuritortus cantonensis]|uniref:Type-F conjugative transfer system pilin assembly protein TrbC n=1 Tax=Parasulfuritortus cantonensis TaxID=2528202 RepID=A0A4R1BS92_9PROT|nr:type-F conjugative transfer system pilin assembly protein TrbC [Parasulfuritortus cantonensis]TCJ20166.1 type-F conjugative transfer system pilin assembly protein TrbC [Parasulfuritortus cantonensis]